MVAHALEVIGDLDCTDDEAKVARHRLLQCQQFHRGLLDFHLEAVQLRVAIDNELCLLPVAVHQRLDGEVSALLSFRRHAQQRFLERRKLIVKVPEAGGTRVSCHPNLPVMYASVRSWRGLVKSCSVCPNSMSSPVKKKAV